MTHGRARVPGHGRGRIAPGAARLVRHLAGCLAGLADRLDGVQRITSTLFGRFCPLCGAAIPGDVPAECGPLVSEGVTAGERAILSGASWVGSAEMRSTPPEAQGFDVRRFRAERREKGCGRV